MKILLTIIFLSLLSSSCSTPSEDLLVRDGLYYKKFSEVPFSGKVTGLRNGSIKNGKAEGEWVGYWDDGQLMYKGNYKNGKREGAWVEFWNDGLLHRKGNYKNGKREGAWISYWSNGQLRGKGNYKNGERDGLFAEYLLGGTIKLSGTGVFKNGVNLSR